MHDVASATPDALTLRHMASERAPPGRRMTLSGAAFAI